MNIKPHVSSLDVSKKLRELGIKQDSIFSWIRDQFTNMWHIKATSKFNKDKVKDYCSAFLSSELVDLIHNYSEKRHEFLLRKCPSNHWQYLDFNSEPFEINHRELSDNQQDCIALMMIKLINDGQFTV